MINKLSSSSLAAGAPAAYPMAEPQAPNALQQQQALSSSSPSAQPAGPQQASPAKSRGSNPKSFAGSSQAFQSELAQALGQGRPELGGESAMAAGGQQAVAQMLSQSTPAQQLAVPTAPQQQSVPMAGTKQQKTGLPEQAIPGIQGTQSTVARGAREKQLPAEGLSQIPSLQQPGQQAGQQAVHSPKGAVPGQSQFPQQGVRKASEAGTRATTQQNAGIAQASPAMVPGVGIEGLRAQARELGGELEYRDSPSQQKRALQAPLLSGADFLGMKTIGQASSAPDVSQVRSVGAQARTAPKAVATNALAGNDASSGFAVGGMQDWRLDRPMHLELVSPAMSEASRSAARGISTEQAGGEFMQDFANDPMLQQSMLGATGTDSFFGGTTQARALGRDGRLRSIDGLRGSRGRGLGNGNLTGEETAAATLAGQQQMTGAAAATVMSGQVVQGAGARERLSTEALADLNQKIVGMSGGMAALGSGGGEIRIRLKPDNLGELHLKVSAQGGQVGLKIQASDERAKKILEESMSHLKESLASQNLSLGRVDVTLAQGAATSQDSTAGQNQSQNQSQSGGDTQGWMAQGGSQQGWSGQGGSGAESFFDDHFDRGFMMGRGGGIRGGAAMSSAFVPKGVSGGAGRLDVRA